LDVPVSGLGFKLDGLGQIDFGDRRIGRV